MSPRDVIAVLLIADGEAASVAIDRALRADGITVRLHCVDGLAAAACSLFREPWDILLCDHTLRGLEAQDVLTVVADLAPDLPVVLLTGTAGDEAVADLMRLGIADVVLKDRLARRLAVIITREVARCRDRAAHRRLLNGVNAVLAGFETGADWRDAVRASLRHIVGSFGAAAAVMWESFAQDLPPRPIAYATCDGQAELDNVPPRLQVGQRLLREAIGGGTVVFVQGGAALGVHPDLRPHISDVAASGFAALICQPLRLSESAFGVTLLFGHELGEAETVLSELNLTTQVLRPALLNKRLHYEHNLLRDALDAVRTGVIITDAVLDPPGPRIVYANQAMARMSGFTVDEMLQHSPRLFHGPQTSRAVLDQIRAALAAAEPVHTELINYRKDGTQFQVELDITPVFDAGQLTHFMAVQRDITRSRHYERQREEREAAFRQESMRAATRLRLAKERAERAEAFLRDAVESMSEGVVIFGPDDRIVMQNEIYRSLFSRNAGLIRDNVSFYELAAQFIESGGGFGDRSKSSEQFRVERARMYREAAGSMDFRTEDGRWIHATDRRMKDGSTVGLRVDITALKTAEQALLEAQHNFQCVAESISEIFWIIDVAKNELLFINGAFERIFGRDRRSMYSGPPTWLHAVHPEDQARVKIVFSGLIEAGGYDIEYRILRPDGQIRWLHETATTSRIGSDKVTHCAGVAEDITLRRHYELQLRQAQKMEALGGLVGGMAHDFNNILGVIMTSLDLLKRQIGRDAAAAELCDEALLGAERGAELIRSLLAFARRQSLNPKPIDANALITMTRELLQRALGETITLRTTLAADLWLVLVDPVQLETALLNFATNARDAMPAGGVFDIVTRNTSLAAEDRELHAGVSPGDYVVIELRDTGVGIASETLNHIFEPFFTTKSPGEGTGLGLAMIYGFARQSGGQLTVYSEPGRGTVFGLYLPRTAQCQAHVLTKGSEPPVIGGTETVLLVEDNAQLRRAVAGQLTSLGYQVRLAEDAQAALAVLESDAALDLLFTDIVMPGGMDGITLAERAIGRRPGLGILLTSGFPDVPNAECRIQTATFLILNKPYSRSELARAIRRALDRSG